MALVQEYPNRIAVDSNNNVYVVGQAEQQFTDASITSLIGPKAFQNSYPFIIRYNSSGVPQWARWMMNGNGVFGYATDVAIDLTNSIYVVGQANGDLHSSIIATTQIGNKTSSTG